jgi:5-hydroxyisourate hydrolase-like protein (transthyretin family)
MHMPSRILEALLFSSSLLSAQATIEGTVVHSVTREGIAGAEVRFLPGKGAVYKAITAADGGFRITDVPNGAYRHGVVKEGFEVPQPIYPSSESTVRVAGKDTVRVTLEIAPIIAMRGQVLDADGNPAPGVRLELNGPVANSRMRDETVSGEDGRFEFKEILPGAFTLVARPKPPSTVNGGEVRIEPVKTYYPSALRPSEQQEIHVLGIADESGVQLRLRADQVHRVRGIVLDELGKPAAGIHVQLARNGGADDSANENLAKMVTNMGGRVMTVYNTPNGYSHAAPEDDGVLTSADGKFEFVSVREGDWMVRASSEWQYLENPKRDVQKIGQSPVLVSRRDVEDLEIRIVPNFEFTATIDWPKDSPPHFIPLFLEPADGGPLVVGLPQPNGPVRFDHAYPGRYYVQSQVANAGDLYVSAIVLEGRNVLNEIVDLRPGMGPLHIVISRGAGTLRGSIEKGSKAWVVVAPASGTGSIRSIDCSPGQNFEISNLAPGDYLVAAFERVVGGVLADPAYRASFAQRAKRVRVEERGQVSLELPVQRWP